MTIRLRRVLSGEYGVPGAGIFRKGDEREVSMEVAARFIGNSEFEVTFEEADLPLRGENGLVEKIGFFGHINAAYGYGGAGISILRALKQAGIETRIDDRYSFGRDGIERTDLPKDAAEQCLPRKYIPQLAITHALPVDYSRCVSPRRIGWSMWETTQIPNASHELGDWAKAINNEVEHFIVPCTHNKEVFATCGVTTPITVLPYGTDTDVWTYQERPERDLFTVVQYGDLTHRKGPLEAVLAFQRAFPDQRDVRLILKTLDGRLGAYRSAPYIPDDRITVIDAKWTRPQLLDFLHKADCGIFLSRGEGFGLVPLQMALTGLPVVMTTNTGMAEYYRANYFYGVRDAGMSEANIGGMWYDPDIDHAAEQLRKVYSDRKSATRRAKSGATFLRNNFSIEAFSRRLGEFLNSYDSIRT